MRPSSIRKSAIGVPRAAYLVLVLMTSLVLHASTLSAGDPAAVFNRPPEPVVAGWGMWQPQPAAVAPHLVLRPHRQPSAAEPVDVHPHDSRAAAGRDRHRGSRHRPEHVSGGRAAVPEAATIHRKKVPYSYGYFGAEEHRHWSMHRGHQQNRIEWVLR